MSKPTKILLAAVAALGLGLYLFFFFQTGVNLNGRYLPHQGDGQYGEKDGVYLQLSGDIKSQGQAEVVYSANPAQSFSLVYTITAAPIAGGLDNLVILENGQPYFAGSYRQDIPWLLDESGEPLLGGLGLGFDGYDASTGAPERLSPLCLARLAWGELTETRGEPACLLVAAVLLLVVAVDLRWPLFFFQLQHMLAVENPQPSDFYLGTQRIGRGVAVVVAGLCLIVGLYMQ